jgi:hypothetical protein
MFGGKMITREKLEYAARNYNGDKYSEEFYTYHLGVLQNAQDISESVSRAVEYLFLWKLGKVRSRKTPSSSQLKFSDSKGHRYYSIPTTETHDKVIKRAVEKGKLEIAIAFRNGAVTYDEIKSYASNLTSSTIVLPAFYVHVWHPVEYPILDKKVWKVFLDQRGKPVSLYTKPTSWSDFEAYTSFFRKLVDDTGLDWRTVDRGLWVLGDRLKVRMNSQRVKPLQGNKFTSLDYDNREEKLNCVPIPLGLMNRVCDAVDQKVNKVPFKHRGIMITHELIRITIGLLNAEPTKTLLQNCRNDVRERTPDGLDKRIKESLNTDLRTANIISDVLEQAGIVEVIHVINPRTGRTVKGTRLLEEWDWQYCL